MTADSGSFAVLYRWTVEPEHEAYFLQRWHEGTKMLREQYGSLGSCLTRAENGDYLAFARWPSEQARADAFEARGELRPWPGIVCFEETRLRVVDDQLVRA
jgi:heme-degrading monooxygenase HmoA